MVATERVSFLFADGRALYGDALEMLSQGKIRNAAEKAWGPPSGPPTPWSWRGTARSRSRPGRRDALSCARVPWIPHSTGFRAISREVQTPSPRQHRRLAPVSAMP